MFSQGQLNSLVGTRRGVKACDRRRCEKQGIDHVIAKMSDRSGVADMFEKLMKKL
jgi:hypothetical protein